MLLNDTKLYAQGEERHAACGERRRDCKTARPQDHKDRKSVEKGKSVDHGGRRIIKKLSVRALITHPARAT